MKNGKVLFELILTYDSNSFIQCNAKKTLYGTVNPISKVGNIINKNIIDKNNNKVQHTPPHIVGHTITKPRFACFIDKVSPSGICVAC